MIYWVFVVPVLFWIISGLRVIQEYESGVIFRLGRFAEVKRAGLNWIVPGVDRMVKVDLRTVTRDVPPQDVITRDKVSLKVSAVIYFRVIDAERAIIQVENFLYATSQLSQTTLRSTLGKLELDDLLAQREKINKELQMVLDQHTEPWGIKVTAVEVKQLDLPPEMQRAMARQAEAGREIGEQGMEIVRARGKMQNPLTGSGGMLIGRVAAVGREHPASSELKPGDRIATLVSLTLTPLVLDEIRAVHKHAERLDVRGR